MGLRNRPGGWGAIAKTLHWLTAALVILAWPLGWAVNRWDGSTLLLGAHLSLGAALLGLLAARLAWRLAGPPPGPAPGLSPLHAGAARLTHGLLLAVILLLLISGYLLVVHMQHGRPAPPLLFGVAEVPLAFRPGEDETLRPSAWTVHLYAAWAVLILAAVHAGAALWHHWVRKDEVLRRML